MRSSLAPLSLATALAATLLLQPGFTQTPEASSSCPVTQPMDPAFETPPGFPSVPAFGGLGAFYAGNQNVWVTVTPGPWHLPHWETGYRQKIFWWTDSYQREPGTLLEPPVPTVEVSGHRLDGPSNPMIVTGTNPGGGGEMGSFLVSGVNFPTTGCWEITARIDDSAMSFVVEVEP